MATNTTISSTVQQPVTLGVGGYNSPLVIASSGAIAPAGNYYSAIGLYLGANAAVATVTNHGGIFATGGDGSSTTGYTGGGAVVLKSAAFLNNSGVIAAGYGGFGEVTGGQGGDGVDLLAGGSIANSGRIFGGAGGYGDSYAGAGGTGVVLDGGATLNNTGTIGGGGGGNSQVYVNQDSAIDATGVYGGAEAVVVNRGLILGGAGGVSGSGDSGDGLYGGLGINMAAGGTLTNSGQIVGGAGGGGAALYSGGGGGYGGALYSDTVNNTGTFLGGVGGAGAFAGAGGGGLVLTGYAVLANNGNIIGGVGGADAVALGGGGTGLRVDGYSTATNSGQITGGAGAAASTNQPAVGGTGGDGVYLHGGTFVNSATVTGGAGGVAAGVGTATSARFGGNGGNGIVANHNNFFTSLYDVSITNNGLAKGGDGGSITSYGGASGNGGYGAEIFYVGITNHGTILGGNGAPGAGYAGVGGAGAVLDHGATLKNTGTVIGGNGGVADQYGAGGTGVFIDDGGTLVNSGMIAGGFQPNGPRADAVYIKGSIAGTLVVDPGASFFGNVVATGTAANLLEVVGSSSIALAGFGTQITGFSAVSFASGAARTIEGGIGGFGTIDGFATNDTIVIDNYTAVLPDAVFNGEETYLFDGAYNELFLSRALAKDIIITDSSSKTTLAAAGGVAHTISAKAEQFVFSGGTATSSVIKSGGVENIYTGGTAANTTIAGGDLILQVGAKIAAGVTFSNTKGGQLTIDSVTMPTATISNFIAGDTIALAGVIYNSKDTVSVKTAGTVTIKGPGVTYNLNIAGATVGETDFAFGPGGLLTKSAAAKPAFLRPAEPTAPPAMIAQTYIHATPTVAPAVLEHAGRGGITTIALWHGPPDVAGMFSKHFFL